MRTANLASEDMTAMKLGELLRVLRWKRLRGGVIICRARGGHNDIHLRSSAGHW